jgi:hypothetical protein
MRNRRKVSFHPIVSTKQIQKKRKNLNVVFVFVNTIASLTFNGTQRQLKATWKEHGIKFNITLWISIVSPQQHSQQYSQAEELQENSVKLEEISISVLSEK